MAKQIKIVGATKKAKVKEPSTGTDAKYVGEEPVWDTERATKFDDNEFDHYLRQSLKYYNYFYGVKDLKKHLVEWARSNTQHDKKTLDRLAKTGDNITSFTACAIARAYTKGMPQRVKEAKYLTTVVNSVVSQINAQVEPADETVSSATKPKVPTIQDRLNAILDKHVLHFEILEDSLYAGASVDPKAFEYLTNKNVPQAMLGKLSAVFEKRYAEITEAKAGTCPDLTEGYSHFKASDYKRMESFYTKLADGITQYTQIKKATKKASVRKPPAKEKLVARLKFLKSDTVLKLVSINPVDIIGAQSLWVYDTKTRKMFYYQAEDLAGALSVKGASIVGYDEVKSVGKTIRKPEVQLKEFMKAGKVALRTFVKDIKAVEIRANGRINANQILLRVA